MTKTEMAEFIQDSLSELEKEVAISYEGTRIYNRHFKELIDDFKVKIQEQVEQSIEDEEQEFDVEETTDAEAFGNGIMEGE
jgi:hypothetical protein